jgi:phenylpyruvate tautomerase PptA (4-oxalocrotonate tautomerase family)
MPLYTVMTQDGLLSAQQRDVIAVELVRIHMTAMGVPANFVHSIFPTYPRNRAYVAADRSPVASIVGVIRAGHTPDEKSRLVQTLWKMFKDKTGISDRDLSVALQEVAPSQAVEAEVPIGDTCCGTAGDRGLLHPELVVSATRDTKAALDTSPAVAYISANRTCEMGLLHATGRPYQSFVFLLEELSRPERPSNLDEA